MIIAGYEYMEKTFTNVYISPELYVINLDVKCLSHLELTDPLDLIKKYSRTGACGNVAEFPPQEMICFSMNHCVSRGRNFANKIWNAFRLVKGWSVDTSQTKCEFGSFYWLVLRRVSRSNWKSSMIITLNTGWVMRWCDIQPIWDDFCSWYLEMVKPEFVDGQAMPVDQKTYESTIAFFEQLLKVVHPWMPFISEELWSLLAERKNKDYCIIVAQWPQVGKKWIQACSKVWNCKVKWLVNCAICVNKNISPKENCPLFQFTSEYGSKGFNELVCKLGNLDTLWYRQRLTHSIPFCTTVWVICSADLSDW